MEIKNCRRKDESQEKKKILYLIQLWRGRNLPYTEISNRLEEKGYKISPKRCGEIAAKGASFKA